MGTGVIAIVAAAIVSSLVTAAQQGRNQQQKPFYLNDTPNHPMHSARYTIHQPGEEVCKAGAKQWAGEVKVSEGNTIFYCKYLAPCLITAKETTQFLPKI